MARGSGPNSAGTYDFGVHARLEDTDRTKTVDTSGSASTVTGSKTIITPMVQTRSAPNVSSHVIATSTTAAALPHMNYCDTLYLTNTSAVAGQRIWVIDSQSASGEGIPLREAIAVSSVNDYYTFPIKIENPNQLQVVAATGTPSLTYVVTRQPTRKFIRITGITFSGTTATVTTAENHGLDTNDRVYIEGVADNSGDGALYMASNGLIAPATVPTVTTFTYTMSGTPSAVAALDTAFSQMTLVV